MPNKIVTCCYCGTRAALVLTGGQRHELSCSSCGAPLHDLKMLPVYKAQKDKSPGRAGPGQSVKPAKPKKVKKRKGLMARVLDEAMDFVEDILD